MSAEYDWSSFEVFTYYRAPLERVWQAWSTAAGLESFFIRRATHTGPDGEARGPDAEARTGDSYHWTFCQPFELRGEFRAVEPRRRIAFTFGGMEAAVEFRETDGAVEARLRQTGCGVDEASRVRDHLNCRSCWIYYFTNLKSVLERGADLRDPQRPEWTDAVRVGWTPEAADGAGEST